MFSLQERQQFHLEQLRAAEFRARAAAQQKLASSDGPGSGQTSPQQVSCFIFTLVKTVKLLKNSNSKTVKF